MNKILNKNSLYPIYRSHLEISSLSCPSQATTMSTSKAEEVTAISPDNGNVSSSSSDIQKEGIIITRDTTEKYDGKLHYVRRGQEVADADTNAIAGYEAEQMRARALLTSEEEKKLLRRIDWHIMPLCAIAFLLKNIDANNVSNARIMNRGSHQNLLTQLGMTANEFNFVSTIYYVSDSSNLHT